jgi:superfamily II DNA/RNA helicase
LAASLVIDSSETIYLHIATDVAARGLDIPDVEVVLFKKKKKYYANNVQDQNVQK